jgi:8-oxo-dGTP pyrophosphatase MutT (NUDIX family)
MFFTIDELKHKLSQPLPGIESQLKMAPKHRAVELEAIRSSAQQAKKSAVLILLFPDNGKLKTVLIKRSEYEGVHSGQISFPGGKHEDSDGSFEVTALREMHEEVGVSPDTIQLVGQLSDLFIPPSNFLVKVFVGYTHKKHQFIPDPKEVQSVIEIGIDEFSDEKSVAEMDFFAKALNSELKAPCYNVNNVVVWGATAMILSELIDVLEN